MLTPKTNSQTFWLREVLRVANGAIVFVCSTSWISLCSLAAHDRSVDKASTVSKRWEELAAAKTRGLFVRFEETYLLNQKQPSSSSSDASNVQVNPQLYSESESGSCGKLQRGGPSWTTTTRKSQIMCMLGRSSRTCDRKLRLSSYTLDAKTNKLIWELFMSTTMKSAVRLRLPYQGNLVAYTNTNFEELKILSDVTSRLIVEIHLKFWILSTMINDFSPSMRSTLCHDQVIKWAKAKVHVYSDSVLCLGNPQWSEKSTKIQNKLD